MATTLTPYAQGFVAIIDGSINLTTSTIRVALLDDAATYETWQSFYSDIAGNEVTGAGYTTLGRRVQNITTWFDVPTVAASPVIWESLTVDFRHAVVYRHITGDLENSHLLWHIDFGTTVSLTDERFVLPWNDAGIFRFNHSAWS